GGLTADVAAGEQHASSPLGATIPGGGAVTRTHVVAKSPDWTRRAAGLTVLAVATEREDARAFAAVAMAALTRRVLGRVEAVGVATAMVAGGVARTDVTAVAAVLVVVEEPRAGGAAARACPAGAVKELDLAHVVVVRARARLEIAPSVV